MCGWWRQPTGCASGTKASTPDGHASHERQEAAPRANIIIFCGTDAFGVTSCNTGRDVCPT